MHKQSYRDRKPERPEKCGAVKPVISPEKIPYQKKRERENENLIRGSPVDNKKIFNKEKVIEHNPENKRGQKAMRLHDGKNHKAGKWDKKFSRPEKRDEIAIERDEEKKPPRQNKPRYSGNRSPKDQPPDASTG
jgi:hypothetical protein